jgi:addiction module HigA family antidote
MAKTYYVTGEPKLEPTHPGALLREPVLPALGISVSEMARRLGVTRQHLHRILAETHPITPEMALRIGKLCGNGPELWLNMQQAYDLWHTKRRLTAELKRIKTERADSSEEERPLRHAAARAGTRRRTRRLRQR